MDASADPTSLPAFLSVHAMLVKAGIPVPHCLAQEVSKGWLLLQDCGDETLMRYGQHHDADPYYRIAIAQMVSWQRSVCPALPAFEPLVHRELSWFPERWCDAHCQAPLSSEERDDYANICDMLLANWAQQPQVPVHRDFHSRNLMVMDDTCVWLDFQDAVQGVLLYDAVSLLYDAYVIFPSDQRRALAEFVRQCQCEQGVTWAEDADRWWEAWLWTALQRQLKMVGLFPKLGREPGKAHFLRDLEKVLLDMKALALTDKRMAPLAALLARRGV